VPRQSPRDRSTLWLGLLCLAAALAGALALLPGCAQQVRPECPLGSRPTKVDTGSETAGGASAKGDLPSQCVTVGGTWKGTASADWSCVPICARGQLLEATDDGKGARSVRCHPEKQCPGGGKP
jgi:hypothetical protein